MISVIISTYNRSRLLEKTLNSLAGINVSNDINWELIVIDNNSKDSTKQIVGYFIKQNKLPLRYVFEPQQGLSYARNRGISESAGEILAFIDDDVIVPDDWLMQVDRAFSQYNVDVIGGKAILRFEQTIPSWVSWLDSETVKCFGSFDRGDKDIIIQNKKDGIPGIGANLCFKKNVFNIIGLFDVTTGRKGNKLLMGEETDLIRRVLLYGGKCVYFPKMYLYHLADSEKLSKRYVLRWKYRMGQWEAHTDKYNNNTMYEKFKVLCWAFKKIITDIIILFGYLVVLEKKKSFMKKVNISEMAGYISYIIIPYKRIYV